MQRLAESQSSLCGRHSIQFTASHTFQIISAVADRIARGKRDGGRFISDGNRRGGDGFAGRFRGQSGRRTRLIGGWKRGRDLNIRRAESLSRQSARAGHARGGGRGARYKVWRG